MLSIVKHKNQSGVVLIISLLVLLVVTLVVATSVQMTGLQEKMASNNKDQNVAFQFAEMALRAGEAHIEAIRKAGSPGIASFCNGTAGLFKASTITVGGVCATAVPDQDAAVTWTDNTLSITVNTGSMLVAEQPRYFITYSDYRAAVGSDPPTYGFTITARGTGSQSTTQVILHSYYGGEVKFP